MEDSELWLNLGFEGISLTAVLRKGYRGVKGESKQVKREVMAVTYGKANGGWAECAKFAVTLKVGETEKQENSAMTPRFRKI